MLLYEHYEETLKELEELEINLDDLSNKELHEALDSLVSRGWLQLEEIFGKRVRKEHTKEEIQKHFNNILNVVPMTRIKRKNDKT
jgi:hypothetical protein